MIKNKSKIFLLIFSLNIAFNVTLFTNSLIFESNVVNLHETTIDLYDLRVSGSEINITSPENKTYTEPMSGYYPATYGFENEVGKTGTDIIFIDATDNGNKFVVINEFNGHQEVLRCESYGNYLQHFETGITKGTIEYWFAGWTEKRHLQHIRTDGGDAIQFQCNDIGTDDDRFQYYNSTDWVNVATATDYRWYHIQFDFDCYIDKFNISVDGVLVAPDVDFLNPGTEFDHFYFEPDEWTGGTYYGYLDAIGFSWDENYNIRDNLNEGLLLSFDNNTSLDWMGYSLDGQSNKTIIGNKTLPFPPNDGVHTIQVFGNNSIGTMYHSEIRYFEIDTSPPVIQINSPDFNQFFGNTSPTYEIFITESHLNTTWYSLNNGITNITFSGLIGTINQTLWDIIIDDDISMIFYANDTWGFESYSTITVRKETIAPISIISYTPYGEMNLINTSTTFTINADDGAGSGVSNIRYKINDSTWVEYTDPFDLSSYAYGYYNITYHSIDNVGNIEDEKSIIVRLVEIPSETPGIAGYNIFIVLSIFTLVIGVIIKKRSKLKL